MSGLEYAQIFEKIGKSVFVELHQFGLFGMDQRLLVFPDAQGTVDRGSGRTAGPVLVHDVDMAAR